MVFDAQLLFVVAGCCDSSVGLAWDQIVSVGIRKVSNAVTVNLWSNRMKLEENKTFWNSTIWLIEEYWAFLDLFRQCERDGRFKYVF